MGVLSVPFNQGYVSSRDPLTLEPGELQQAKGVYYKPNDQRAWKIPGRSLFGTADPDGAIQDLALLKFDAPATDFLIAKIVGKIVKAAPGLTAPFFDLVSGLDPSSTGISLAHMDDRWYITDGVSPMIVIEADGTVRNAGMVPPSEVPIVATSNDTGSTIGRPTVADGSDFVAPALAYDADATTASALEIPELRTPDDADDFDAVGTWRDFSSEAAADRQLIVDWSIDPVGSPTYSPGAPAGNMRIDLLVSFNDGVSYDAIYTKYVALISFARPFVPPGPLSTSVAVGVDSDQVRVRVLVHGEKFCTPPMTIRVSDIRIVSGSQTGGFSTTGGLIYAVTEYDANRGLESVPGPPSTLVEMTTENVAEFDLPTAAKNPNTTDWNVYRTTDAGVYPQQAWLIRTLPVAETHFIDDFTIDKDTEGIRLVDLITVGELPFFRNVVPPILSQLTAFDGSLVGVIGRASPYSEQGFPEYWPEINIISSFPMEEHDTLVAVAGVGTALLYGAEETMFTLTTLPRVVAGSLNNADVEKLKGSPGLVSRRAISVFSVSGESQASWVSPFGIYWTNAVSHRRLSLDLDWDAEVVQDKLASSLLSWDIAKQLLWFNHDADGDGINDRETPVHMSDAHRKESGAAKLGQPTPKSTCAEAHGLVDGKAYRWTAHPSDGKVYVEDQGGVDAATGDPVAMTAETGKYVGSRTTISCLKAALWHSDWGADAVCTLTVRTMRESSQIQQTKSAPVSLVGQRSHEMAVLRAGDWFTVKIEQATEHVGAILTTQIEAEDYGPTGSTPSL